MNPADILILAIVVVAMCLCIRSIRKNFKSGGGCIGCPDSESCHKKQSARSSCNCEGTLRPEDIHIKRRKT